jgi:hypothetical protein
MGYLSSGAAKAFKKGTRRAHVPDWFQPLSYVFGGIAVLVIVLLFLTADDPVSYEVVKPKPAVENGTSTDTAPTTAPSGADVTLQTGSGPVTLPVGALDMARRAASALYTGDYTGVPIYGGGETPPVVLVWGDPLIGDVVAAESFADGSWRLIFSADPDRDGPERVREIMVFVAEENGNWAYLPG